jgi:hypothetical protein
VSWKEHLLKSSLPLEQLVAEKLTQLGFFVSGEYTYLRLDEAGLAKEFSVDIDVSRFVPDEERSWGDLNLAIECKYRHRNVSWIFGRRVNPELQSVGLVRVHDELTTISIDRDAIDKWEGGLIECEKGIELTQTSNNPHDLEHGLSQLRHASVHRAFKQVSEQAQTLHESDLLVIFDCPILVTTANLLVLNEGVTLEEIEGAESLENVSQVVPYLIHSRNPGPQLREIIQDSLDELYHKEANLVERFAVLCPIRSRLDPAWRGHEGSQPLEFLLDVYLGTDLRTSTEHVAVVNLVALDKFVDELWKALLVTSSTAKRIASLEYDASAGKSRMLPL